MPGYNEESLHYSFLLLRINSKIKVVFWDTQIMPQSCGFNGNSYIIFILNWDDLMTLILPMFTFSYIVDEVSSLANP